MNTFEVRDYMQFFKTFKDVFPRDRLPESLNIKCGIIINTDKAEDPGEHWVSIYKNQKGFVIYFDSFGLPPFHTEIIKFINKISPIGWFYNTITFQSVYQDTCGMYCVFFLTCMLRHGDFNYFRAIFNSKPNLNDVLAKIIYKYQKLQPK